MILVKAIVWRYYANSISYISSIKQPGYHAAVTSGESYSVKWKKVEQLLCLESPQSWAKYLRQTLVFMWNSALREKFNFYFFRSFLLVLTKFSFWKNDWALGYNSIKFWNYSDFPNFLSSLISKVLSCSATPEAARIYHVYAQKLVRVSHNTLSTLFRSTLMNFSFRVSFSVIKLWFSMIRFS